MYLSLKTLYSLLSTKHGGAEGPWHGTYYIQPSARPEFNGMDCLNASAVLRNIAGQDVEKKSQGCAGTAGLSPNC